MKSNLAVSSLKKNDEIIEVGGDKKYGVIQSIDENYVTVKVLSKYNNIVKERVFVKVPFNLKITRKEIDRNDWIKYHE